MRSSTHKTDIVICASPKQRRSPQKPEVETIGPGGQAADQRAIDSGPRAYHSQLLRYHTAHHATAPNGGKTRSIPDEHQTGQVLRCYFHCHESVPSVSLPESIRRSVADLSAANRSTVIPSLRLSQVEETLITKGSKSTSHRLWRQLLGILCVTLVLVSTTLQVAHSHPKNLLHADCALCATAHVTAHAVATPAPAVLTMLVGTVQCFPPLSAPHTISTFALFVRPPPHQLPLA